MNNKKIRLIELFSGAKDSKELLLRLSLISPKPLEPGKTIIFLDEIQEFKDIGDWFQK